MEVVDHGKLVEGTGVAAVTRGTNLDRMVRWAAIVKYPSGLFDSFYSHGRCGC